MLHGHDEHLNQLDAHLAFLLNVLGGCDVAPDSIQSFPLAPRCARQRRPYEVVETFLRPIVYVVDEVPGLDNLHHVVLG
eukprot:905372-Heterocapsa_arctica.AAC.1